MKDIRLILTLLVFIVFALLFSETNPAFAQSHNTDYLLGSHSLDNKVAPKEEEAPSVLLSIRPAQEEGKDEVGTKPKQIAQAQPDLKPGINQADIHLGLSDETYNLAKIWGLLPSLEQLRSTPKSYNSDQLGKVIKRIIIQQEVTETVLSKMFDIRTTLNAIDRQVAKSQEIRAVLAEKRDKAIRFNTYADFVAGGITGILSGALRLGTLEFITPDVVDVVEGVAQTGLAGLAFKNENIEHHLEKGIPNLLAKLFYPHHKAIHEFPDSVWLYLNSVPIDSKTNLTRREELIGRWSSSKFCLIHKGHKQTRKQRARHVSGLQGKYAKLSIDLLEDRAAMLQDLRSQVTLMEEHLAEIYRQSKQY